MIIMENHLLYERMVDSLFSTFKVRLKLSYFTYRHWRVWGWCRGITVSQWRVFWHSGRIYLWLRLWLQTFSRWNLMWRCSFSVHNIDLVSAWFLDADECLTDEMCPVGMECVEEDCFFTCQPCDIKTRSRSSKRRRTSSKSSSSSSKKSGSKRKCENYYE